MADGVIKLPISKGRKELTFYVGTAQINGGSQQAPSVNMRIDKDADFVAMRGPWLVMWPSYSSPADKTLSIPQTSSVVIRDGSTRRALSLVGGSPDAIVLNTDIAKMTSAYLGMPAPYSLAAGTNVFAEVTNPAASWSGDLYFVYEGFSVYPLLPADIPATLEAYALPAVLNGNQNIADPSVLSSSVQGQDVKITNDGSGKFLVKGLTIQCVDASGTGADVTDALLPATGLQITDSTSGGKQWFRNPSLTSGNIPICPAGIPTYARAKLPFCRPRLIDENGTVDVQIIFPTIAAALTYLHGAATWPVQFSVSLYGARIPR